jgi:RNase P/RNase MRP subunit p29
MSVVGEVVAVMHSRDPTKVGRSGKAVLETANTVLLMTERGRITVEKKGTVFLFTPSGRLAAGESIQGRLEDRLRSKSR